MSRRENNDESYDTRHLSWRVPHSPRAEQVNFGERKGPSTPKPASKLRRGSDPPPRRTPFSPLRDRTSAGTAAPLVVGSSSSTIATPALTPINDAEVDTNSELNTFQNKLWMVLLANLDRSIDELYRLCEEEEDKFRCEETMDKLKRSLRDFSKLIERIDEQQKFQTSPAGMSGGISWEVRKPSSTVTSTSAAPTIITQLMEAEDPELFARLKAVSSNRKASATTPAPSSHPTISRLNAKAEPFKPSTCSKRRDENQPATVSSAVTSAAAPVLGSAASDVPTPERLKVEPQHQSNTLASAHRGPSPLQAVALLETKPSAPIVAAPKSTNLHAAKSISAGTVTPGTAAPQHSTLSSVEHSTPPAVPAESDWDADTQAEVQEASEQVWAEAEAWVEAEAAAEEKEWTLFFQSPYNTSGSGSKKKSEKSQQWNARSSKTASNTDSRSQIVGSGEATAPAGSKGSVVAFSLSGTSMLGLTDTEHHEQRHISAIGRDYESRVLPSIPDTIARQRSDGGSFVPDIKLARSSAGTDAGADADPGTVARAEGACRRAAGEAPRLCIDTASEVVYDSSIDAMLDPACYYSDPSRSVGCDVVLVTAHERVEPLIGRKQQSSVQRGTGVAPTVGTGSAAAGTPPSVAVSLLSRRIPLQELTLPPPDETQARAQAQAQSNEDGSRLSGGQQSRTKISLRGKVDHPKHGSIASSHIAVGNTRNTVAGSIVPEAISQRVSPGGPSHQSRHTPEMGEGVKSCTDRVTLSALERERDLVRKNSSDSMDGNTSQVSASQRGIVDAHHAFDDSDRDADALGTPMSEDGHSDVFGSVSRDSGYADGDEQEQEDDDERETEEEEQQVEAGGAAVSGGERDGGGYSTPPPADTHRAVRRIGSRSSIDSTGSNKSSASTGRSSTGRYGRAGGSGNWAAGLFVLGRSLHDKLSSPDRKKALSPSEALKALEARHNLAEYNRERSVAEKIQKASIASIRVRIRGEKEQLRLALAEQAWETKLKDAQERHSIYINKIKGRANNENTKVDEIAFINSLNSEALAEELQKKLEDVEARVLAASERRKERLESISGQQRRKNSRKAQQMSELRLALEKQKMERWEKLQKRLHAVQERRIARLAELSQRIAEQELQPSPRSLSAHSSPAKGSAIAPSAALTFSSSLPHADSSSLTAAVSSAAGSRLGAIDVRRKAAATVTAVVADGAISELVRSSMNSTVALLQSIRETEEDPRAATSLARGLSQRPSSVPVPFPPASLLADVGDMAAAGMTALKNAGGDGARKGGKKPKKRKNKKKPSAFPLFDIDAAFDAADERETAESESAPPLTAGTSEKGSQFFHKQDRFEFAVPSSGCHINRSSLLWHRTISRSLGSALAETHHESTVSQQRSEKTVDRPSSTPLLTAAVQASFKKMAATLRKKNVSAARHGLSASAISTAARMGLAACGGQQGVGEQRNQGAEAQVRAGVEGTMGATRQGGAITSDEDLARSECAALFALSRRASSISSSLVDSISGSDVASAACSRSNTEPGIEENNSRKGVTQRREQIDTLGAELAWILAQAMRCESAGFFPALPASAKLSLADTALERLSVPVCASQINPLLLRRPSSALAHVSSDSDRVSATAENFRAGGNAEAEAGAEIGSMGLLFSTEEMMAGTGSGSAEERARRLIQRVDIPPCTPFSSFSSSSSSSSSCASVDADARLVDLSSLSVDAFIASGGIALLRLVLGHETGLLSSPAHFVCALQDMLLEDHASPPYMPPSHETSSDSSPATQIPHSNASRISIWSKVMRLLEQCSRRTQGVRDLLCTGLLPLLGDLLFLSLDLQASLALSSSSPSSPLPLPLSFSADRDRGSTADRQDVASGSNSSSGSSCCSMAVVGEVVNELASMVAGGLISVLQQCGSLSPTSSVASGTAVTAEARLDGRRSSEEGAQLSEPAFSPFLPTLTATGILDPRDASGTLDLDLMWQLDWSLFNAGHVTMAGELLQRVADAVHASQKRLTLLLSTHSAHRTASEHEQRALSGTERATHIAAAEFEEGIREAGRAHAQALTETSAAALAVQQLCAVVSDILRLSTGRLSFSHSAAADWSLVSASTLQLSPTNYSTYINRLSFSPRPQHSMPHGQYTATTSKSSELSGSFSTTTVSGKMVAKEGRVMSSLLRRAHIAQNAMRALRELMLLDAATFAALLTRTTRALLSPPSHSPHTAVTGSAREGACEQRGLDRAPTSQSLLQAGPAHPQIRSSGDAERQQREVYEAELLQRTATAVANHMAQRSFPLVRRLVGTVLELGYTDIGLVQPDLSKEQEMEWMETLHYCVYIAWRLLTVSACAPSPSASPRPSGNTDTDVPPFVPTHALAPASRAAASCTEQRVSKEEAEGFLCEVLSVISLCCLRNERMQRAAGSSTSECPFLLALPPTTRTSSVEAVFGAGRQMRGRDVTQEAEGMVKEQERREDQASAVVAATRRVVHVLYPATASGGCTLLHALCRLPVKLFKDKRLKLYLASALLVLSLDFYSNLVVVRREAKGSFLLTYLRRAHAELQRTEALMRESAAHPAVALPPIASADANKEDNAAMWQRRHHGNADSVVGSPAGSAESQSGGDGGGAGERGEDAVVRRSAVQRLASMSLLLPTELWSIALVALAKNEASVEAIDS